MCVARLSTAKIWEVIVSAAELITGRISRRPETVETAIWRVVRKGTREELAWRSPCAPRLFPSRQPLRSGMFVFDYCRSTFLITLLPEDHEGCLTSAELDCGLGATCKHVLQPDSDFGVESRVLVASQNLSTKCPESLRYCSPTVSKKGQMRARLHETEVRSPGLACTMEG